ncbi:MAG: M6 family metalloprotease domain-containing protein [Caldisericia bacterium]|nr:M6 family metalloprotease domain-containing protein [Caldisericia bacterium]
MRKIILLSLSVVIAVCCFGIGTISADLDKKYPIANLGQIKQELAKTVSKLSFLHNNKPSTPTSPTLGGGDGEKKVCVIPLYFEDSKYTYVRESLRVKFERGKEKSLAGYFWDASGGKMNVTFGPDGIHEWIKMPKKLSEYDTNSNEGINALLNDGLTAADKAGINWSDYDADGNGNPDHIIIVWAGNSWTIGGPMPGDFTFYDTESNTAYISIGEDVGVGFPLITILHEFAHASIPLWDLYDYSYSSSPTGGWDLMGEGVWSNYCGLTAFHRWKAGWIEPITITEPGTYYVDDLNGDGTNKMYKIPIPGSDEEWLCLENRTRKGCDGYFQGAPDSGLVIYHVDDKRPYAHRFNTLGADDNGVVWRTHGIVVLDPGGSTLHKTAVWGADISRTKITAQTTPNTLPYRKGNSDKTVSITEISERGTRMSFKVDFVSPERPIVSVEQQVVFGKIVTGRQVTKTVNFRNVGVGKLFIQMKASENWISLDRNSFIGNDEEVNITIDTSTLKLGKYTAKVNYVNQSSEVNGYIELVFEVVPLEGDLNADGMVDNADIEMFLKYYGLTAEDNGFDAKYDFNSDGVIDILDFMLLARNYSVDKK